MHRITALEPHPLFDRAATRTIEHAVQATLPPHTLMQHAGRAVAQLAQAVAPHARSIWIACGPGNNGGDGLEAALHLHQRGYSVSVTWLGHTDHAPSDALHALRRAQAAGVPFAPAPPSITHLTAQDLYIDALLGIGLQDADPQHPRQPDPRLLTCLHALQHSPAPVLAVDIPSGLNANTGQPAGGLTPPTAQHTLSLLGLKPGLFTGMGRDVCGQVWLDTLEATHSQPPG